MAESSRLPVIRKLAVGLLVLLVFLLPYGRYLWVGEFWNAQKVVALVFMAAIAAGMCSGKFRVGIKLAVPVAVLVAVKCAAIAGVALEGVEPDWRFAVNWLQVLILMACVAVTLAGRKDLTVFYKSLVVSNLVSCLVFEVLYIQLLQMWSVFGYAETPRMGGGFGYRDVADDAGMLGYGGASGYAFQMSMLLPALIFALREAKRAKWGRGWMVVSVLSLIAAACNLLLTMQRTAYLLAFLLVAGLVMGGRLVSFRGVVLSAAALGGALGLAACFDVLPGIQDRLEAVKSAVLLDRSDTAVDLRARVLWQAAAMIAERPIAGYGPGSASMAGEAAFGARNSVENGFLNSAFENGAPYAFVYSLWLAAVVWTTRRRPARDYMGWGLWISVICGLAYGLTQAIESSVWWAVIVGALLSPAARGGHDDTPEAAA